MKDKTNKRRVLSVSDTVLLAVQIVLVTVMLTAASIGTFAFYLKNTASTANNFTVGIPKVVVNEPGVDPAHVLWGTNTKPVTLSIPSDSPGGAVRASIIPVLKDSSGNVLPSSSAALSQPVSNTVVMGDITLYFASGWNTNWFFKDGIFYYKKALKTGETTSQLLAGVTLTNNTAEMRAKYQSITVKIEVMADVLQASNDALTNWGVTVDSLGNIS